MGQTVTGSGDAWQAIRGTDVEASARSLLGATVTAHGVTVRLTEVEAYSGVGDDPASHAHRGLTRRNAVMFGPAGVLYVYFTYGMHWCMNVVCGPVGRASAVLLRAGAVVDGIEIARSRRLGRSGSPVADRDLARGPARLTMALDVTGDEYGTPLLDGTGSVTLRTPVDAVDASDIRSGPRVGIAVGVDKPWRFWLDGDRSVSTFRPRPPRPERPPRP
ncbi:MAG TPA: DNA-3-methyladenine glycosylase [Micromonosporaceae bacterium]|nr:DNA-3-methyladenine glycosylase [Micromonosporaceae bacterium]